MIPSWSARWRVYARSTVIPQTGSRRTISSTTGSSETGSGRAPATVAGRGRSDEVRPPPADLDELGQDREGDLLRGLRAEIETGRRPQRRDALGPRPSISWRSQSRTTPARVGEATSPTHDASRVSASPTASSSQMPWLATTTYGDASGSRPRMLADACTLGLESSRLDPSSSPRGGGRSAHPAADGYRAVATITGRGRVASPSTTTGPGILGIRFAVKDPSGVVRASTVSTGPGPHDAIRASAASAAWRWAFRRRSHEERDPAFHAWPPARFDRSRAAWTTSTLG